MKRFFLVYLFLIPLLKAEAQQLSPASTWEGKIGAVRIVLKLSEDSLTHQPKAVYDSPDQGAFGLAVTELKIDTDSLRAYSAVIGGGFHGKFNKDKSEIEGVWSQRGTAIPLTIKRVADAKALVRPQTPKAPFPYKEEKIIYYNQDKSIRFGATLTFPSSSKPLPAVILITGSGQQDRDETLFGHKPFWVIADHLSRNGIAVLRVDDRGVGETTGEVMKATSADFAKDVLAGIDYLGTRQDIDSKKIGLIGHSEGGVIAPLAANQSSDVAFIVSLAGVGIKGSELLSKQMEDVFSRQGMTAAEDIARIRSLIDMMIRLNNKYINEEDLKQGFRPSFEEWRNQQPDEFLKKTGLKGAGSDENINMMASRIFMPWMRYFMNYNPAITFAKLKIPVLAMNGGKDVQVSAKENLAGFDKYLTQAGNKDFKIVLLPGLNHLFQTAKTGAEDEYETIEETISPEALKVMTDWISAHVY